MKPSERDPTACMALVELLMEAGAPPGVVNVIHGQHDCVNFICDHPDIRAISFVGGDPAGRHIYNRGSANGKRVQCNMGAKNHGVIMPDANKEYVVNQLVGAAFGAAGQRCMALTTAVMVGKANQRSNNNGQQKITNFYSKSGEPQSKSRNKKPLPKGAAFNFEPSWVFSDCALMMFS